MGKRALWSICIAVLLFGAPCLRLPALAEAGDPVVVDSDNGVYVRSRPSADSEILGGLPDGQVVTVQEIENEEWVRISGGYVRRAYLTEVSEETDPPDEWEEWPDDTDPEENSPAREEETGENSEDEDNSADDRYVTSWDEDLGRAVTEYAAGFEGLPYVWGGESLETGADCSGFTRAVYAHFGVDLPHFDQYQRNCGLEVSSISEARPGDLIFYKDHVTIYLGDGKVINCSCEEVGTKIMRADYKAVEMVRRIFY